VVGSGLGGGVGVGVGFGLGLGFGQSVPPPSLSLSLSLSSSLSASLSLSLSLSVSPSLSESESESESESVSVPVPVPGHFERSGVEDVASVELSASMHPAPASRAANKRAASGLSMNVPSLVAEGKSNGYARATTLAFQRLGRREVYATRTRWTYSRATTGSPAAA
jgi:hypothetical protein